jgi:calcineurin-like phosphoesterase family protein
MNGALISKYFASADPFLTISDGKRELSLCHYPLLTWRHERRSYMIHGHIHNRTDHDFWPLLCARERVLNAGVDINNYMPVAFDELFENNQAFKEAHRQPVSDCTGSELDS